MEKMPVGLKGLVVAGLPAALMSSLASVSNFLYTFRSMNFLTFAAWFFLFSVTVCVVASLLTPAPSAAQVQGLTLATLAEQQKADNRGSYNVGDIVVLLAVIAIVAYVMISFTG